MRADFSFMSRRGLAEAPPPVLGWVGVGGGAGQSPRLWRPQTFEYSAPPLPDPPPQGGRGNRGLRANAALLGLPR
jgi:hypothetical protein